MARHRPQPEEPKAPADDRAHAPGKRRMGPVPPTERIRRAVPAKGMHDQPWVPTSGLVGRSRRSARRG